MEKSVLIRIGIGSVVVVAIIVAIFAVMKNRNSQDSSAAGQQNTQQDSDKQTATNTQNQHEMMPIDCAPPNDEQWYRTDDTFVIDPKNSKNMWINVEYKGFYRTTDGGSTWTKSVSGITTVHKDQTSGKPCYGEYPVATIDPTNSSRLLLATSGSPGYLTDSISKGGGVYESTDGGKSWKQKISNTMNSYVTHALAIDGKNPNTWYYGTSAAPASNTEADPNKIYVEKGLIYKTADNGKNWTELPTGISKNARLSHFFIDPNNSSHLIAASITMERNATGPNTVTKNQLGIIESNDGGSTWKRIDSLAEGMNAAMDMDMSSKNFSNVFFTPSVGSGQPKSFYSTDGGKTFSEANMAIDVARFDPNDSTGKRLIGYAWQKGTGKTLYESTDSGKTWKAYGTLPSEITELMDKKTRISEITWDPADKNTFYLNGAGGLLWKSTDNGQSWTKLLSYDELTD